MKPERTFEAERPLAQHCAKLLRTGPDIAGLADAADEFTGNLARLLARGLTQVGGGDNLCVRPLPLREATMAELTQDMQEPATHGLFRSAAPDIRILASFELQTVLLLMDRAFGGKGTLPDPLPIELPLSADLFANRLERVTAAALGLALGCAGDTPVVLEQRAKSIGRLAPFKAGTPMIALSFEITFGEEDTKPLTLCVERDALLPILDTDKRTPASGRPRTPPEGTAQGPLGNIPLRIGATLVDMTLEFSKLAALRPGDILPVAVSRTVPLRAGNAVIAHGTIGESDDRLAIQITQAFQTTEGHLT